MCDSEFNFVNAGSLSLPEMKNWLKDDQVLFGLVRMGFGCGRFRRIKWIFICWSGSGVGHIKRARAQSNRGTLKTKLGATSVDIEAACAEEITLDIVIEKVRRATVVDGDDDALGDSDPYTVSSFMKALEGA